MSEEDGPIHSPEPTQDAMDLAKTAGQILREARQAHGLDVAALAVLLKVPVKKLEALEEDRLDELPDTVFVRALASSVCRTLKMDAAPVLEKLPQFNARQLDQGGGSSIHVSFRHPSDGPAPSPLASLNPLVVLGVVAILLAAIVLMMMPDFFARNTSSASVALTSAQAGTANVPMGQPVNPSAAVFGANLAASVASASASPSPTALAGQPSSNTSGNETSTIPKLTVMPGISAPSLSNPSVTLSSMHSTLALPVPADSVIVFAASGESWVQVRDAQGAIILQRTLQNGERAGAGPSLGKLPFSVVVGRTHLTQVSLRGQPFDLVPVSSKDGVARFEVK